MSKSILPAAAAAQPSAFYKSGGTRLKMIDDALSNERFRVVEEVYVKRLNGNSRHVRHSGPNRYLSKKDRCAAKQNVIDLEATVKLERTRST